METENIINKAISEFIENFNETLDERMVEAPELDNNKIENFIREYFNIKKFKEARDYFYSIIETCIPGKNTRIDWSLGREEAMKTPEYKIHYRYSEISYSWYSANCYAGLENTWVKVNGKTHTDEEAAKIATDKWCELLFNWHLQDNGALNETHGGGFPACALGTYLAELSKDNITEEMKKKAHDLFYQYYLRLIHYDNTHDYSDILWLENTLKDESGEYTWKYGFDYDMYCDYDPAWSLYLILVNSGIDGKDARNICPWKTGISIRLVDNAVIYNTYQKKEEI